MKKKILNSEQSAPETLVKSKERVAKHGEVFTGSREVKAMVDLVDASVSHPESTVLEPACGTGNFLVEILCRRLSYAAQKWGRPTDRPEYEKNLLLSLSTLYGVDIQHDNVEATQKRLLGIASQNYRGLYGKKSDVRILNAAAAILETNILHGNALTLRSPIDPFEPLVFTQWSFAGPRVTRRRFSFSGLVNKEKEGLSHVNDLGQTTFTAAPVDTLPSVLWLNLTPSTPLSSFLE